MLKNYMLIALRNLRRNKLFSVINIAGLSISISAALVIYLIVQHEFSFDTHHSDGDRVYRVTTLSYFSGDEFPNSGVPAPLSKAIASDIKGIEEVAPFYLWSPEISIATGKVEHPFAPHQTEVIFAGKGYFDLLSYDWIYGSPETSLQASNQVVLTESRAKSLFSIQNALDAVGRTITFNDKVQTTVTGIVKDIDQHTDFIFRIFVSLSTAEKADLEEYLYFENWDNVNSDVQLLVKLAPGIAPEQIETQFPTLLRKYLEDDPESKRIHQLQALTDIHFNPKFNNFNQPQAHKPTLYGLLLVAFFLLLLGSINFVNISTALSSQRAKEISVRKTFGSLKKQIVSQFLGETLIYTSLAAILSLAFTPFVFIAFQDFIPSGLTSASLWQPHVFIFLFLLVCLLGILSGAYPAFILSRLRPLWLQKNKGTISGTKPQGQWLQQSLLTLQFVIAISLILGTMIVNQQLRFALNKDLGFHQDAVVTFTIPWERRQEKSRFALQNQLQNIAGIEKVSLGSDPPASASTNSSTLQFTRNDDINETHVHFKFGDENYLDLYQLKLLAGRNFQAKDSVREYIINETYAEILGFSDPSDAVGQILKRDEQEATIVGVVEDFHLKSIHEPIKPLVITTDDIQLRTYHVALASNAHFSQALEKIEKAWNEAYPEASFAYRFVDQRIADFYRQEQRTVKLLFWSTAIAVLISCLGLFGLTSISVVRRTKEIGIRKVLGASVRSILIMLYVNFFKILLISFFIGILLANYFMTDWLDNFAYKTEIHWWLFIIPGLLILLIGLITVSVQTIKAARQNPVESLRYE
jgi:putative ABC transport system permease protein